MNKANKKRLKKIQVFQLRKAEHFDLLNTSLFFTKIVVNICWLLDYREIVRLILELSRYFHKRLAGDPRKYLQVPTGYIFKGGLCELRD